MRKDIKLVAPVMASAIRNADRSSRFFNDIIVQDAFSAAQSIGHLVLKDLAAIDVRKEVAKIPNPVLVLHGEHDEVLPLKDAMALADLLPNGQFHLLPGIGHSANIECPKLFVEIVDQFLF
jgi:pimeloyl-ACP methyl ester carboxylesterase